MIARALEKYIRMSPRKVRYVMDALRKRTVADALNILSTTNRRAAKPLTKAIASAFANAKQVDPTLVEHQVVISRITADGGPVWKRFRPAAFGRAVMIRKGTSHITVELDRVNGHTVVTTPPVTKTKMKQQPHQARKAASVAGATTGRRPRAMKRTAGSKS